MENFFIPPYVSSVLTKIEDSGYEAWLVGGCVRDMLGNILPHDYDIASNAPCSAICGMFDRVIETGIKHGTVTVISDGHPIEVTRYRIDGSYADHRRPNSVDFTAEFENDLKRRDFTVNAIGYSEKRGLFDPFGGQNDLKLGILRTVGDPCMRFDEDALRIMRAVRFASSLGYTIEDDTLAAIKRLAPTLKNVSAERIFSELKKALCGKRPSLISLLTENGGLAHLGLGQGEYNSTKDGLDGEKRTHIGLWSAGDLSPLDQIDSHLVIRMAALFRLCNTDPLNALKSLKSDKATRTSVCILFEMLKSDLPLDRASLKRLMSKADLDSIYALISAQRVIFGQDTDGAESQLADIIKKGEPYRICDLAVNGDDLKKAGIVGKMAGDTLNALLERVIEQPELNTPDLLKLIIDSH